MFTGFSEREAKACVKILDMPDCLEDAIEQYERLLEEDDDQT